MCRGNATRKGAVFPRLYNLGLSLPFAAKLTEFFIGVVDAPRLPHKNIYKLIKQHNLNLASKDQLFDDNAVLVMQDAMFAIFRPELVVENYEANRATGKKAYLLPYIENGKAYHVKGFLNEFKAVADKATTELNKWAEQASQIICLDPAIALTYREEYPRYSSEKANF